MSLKSLFAALTLAIALPALAAPVYTNDFESNAAGFSGAGFLDGTQGYAGLGYGNQFLHNDAWGNPAPASTLTLNLANAVAGASLNLDLAVIDSWDGYNCCGPDYFNVRVDGNLLFSQYFDDFSSATVAPGLTNVVYGAGLGFSGWADAAYTLNVGLGTLSAGSHTIEFFASGNGWQAGADESWAIDNLRIDGREINAVPEPMGPALMLAGLGALVAIRRRR